MCPTLEIMFDLFFRRVNNNLHRWSKLLFNIHPNLAFVLDFSNVQARIRIHHIFARSILLAWFLLFPICYGYACHFYQTYIECCIQWSARIFILLIYIHVSFLFSLIDNAFRKYAIMVFYAKYTFDAIKSRFCIYTHANQKQKMYLVLIFLFCEMKYW